MTLLPRRPSGPAMPALPGASALPGAPALPGGPRAGSPAAGGPLPGTPMANPFGASTAAKQVGMLPRGGQLGFAAPKPGLGLQGPARRPGMATPPALPASAHSGVPQAFNRPLRSHHDQDEAQRQQAQQEGPIDPRMLLVDHIARVAEQLAALVEIENEELIRGRIIKIKEHQDLKSELTAAYIQSVRALKDNPPERNEQNQPRLDALRRLGERLEFVVDTHMKLCEAGIRTAEHLVKKIRSDVAAHDGHGLQYNHPALQNRQRKMLQERVSPVALHQVV